MAPVRPHRTCGLPFLLLPRDYPTVCLLRNHGKGLSHFAGSRADTMGDESNFGKSYRTGKVSDPS
jgi:hypothetical protein